MATLEFDFIHVLIGCGLTVALVFGVELWRQSTRSGAEKAKSH
jgi:hypothetical protein